MRYSYFAPVVLVLAAAACNDGPLSPEDAALYFTGGGGKLSLAATQTAEGVWERRVEYDWTAQRYVSEIHVGHDMRLLPERDRVEILPGQTVWVSYQVDAQRRMASDEIVEGVRGQTCVTNTGRSPVGRFVVVEQVLASVGGSLKAVEGATTIRHVDERLEAGATRCVDYEILFDAQPGVTYRVAAAMAAHAGGAAAAQASADFSAAPELRLVEIDAEAWMRDGGYAGCAATLGPDFICTSAHGLAIPRDQRIAPPTATGHLGMSFMIDIRNEGVCGETFVYTISEPLREGGPNPPGGEIREVSGSLVITTGDCPPPGGSACPLSAAAWRQLYGDGSDAAVAAEFYGMFLGQPRGEKTFPMNGPDAVAYAFGRAGVTNPIGELYAQLYAAKLNIARGVDSRPVREARIAADAFLTTHTAADWASLTADQQKAIVDWVETLTAYNEGRLTDCRGPQPPPTGEGCTRTIGYWKTHAGFGPQADVVTPLLPVWLGTAAASKSVFVTSAAQAVALLNKSSDASNGINKLYAQLLGAKLNIKNGASGSAILQAITQADVFLSTHAATDWGSLTASERQQVLTWAAVFDDYNNGRLGPGHCD